MQCKIKARSRIQLLKYKCLVLFGPLQGTLQRSLTFHLPNVLTASPKLMWCPLSMCNWGSSRSPPTIKRVQMANVGLSYSRGHLVPAELPLFSPFWPLDAPGRFLSLLWPVRCLPAQNQCFDYVITTQIESHTHRTV